MLKCEGKPIDISEATCIILKSKTCVQQFTLGTQSHSMAFAFIMSQTWSDETQKIANIYPIIIFRNSLFDSPVKCTCSV